MKAFKFVAPCTVKLTFRYFSSRLINIWNSTESGIESTKINDNIEQNYMLKRHRKWRNATYKYRLISPRILSGCIFYLHMNWENSKTIQDFSRTSHTPRRLCFVASFIKLSSLYGVRRLSGVEEGYEILFFGAKQRRILKNKKPLKADRR